MSTAARADIAGAREARATRGDLSIERRSIANHVMTSIGECAYEWDIEADHLHWSEGTEQLLCLDTIEQVCSSRNFNGLMLPTAATSRNDAIFSSKEIDDGRGVAYRLQYALSATALKTSSDIWVEDSGRWFAGADGVPNRSHGVVRLINERRSHEERLNRLSKFDPLTGLYNRAHLNQCLEDAFKEINQNGETASFVVVGLEHVDLINSVYGYDAGDAVISEVARRMHENLRDRDVIGRFSGAKIGMILPACDGRGLLVAGYRILNLLRENVVTTEKGPIAVSVSIGGVLMPQYARDSKQVFMAAHQALNESRRARDASMVSYQPDAKQDTERQRSAHMAETIVSALKESSIHLAWQPVVDAKTKEIVFHEALIRLETSDGNALVAGDFVDVAQRLGLIRLVDHHALDLALETLHTAPTALFSINVSFETACDPEWLSKLAQNVMKRPDIAERLIIEVTESYAADSLTEAQQFIKSVQDLGCKVALDDFGAGFTSFRNLKSLPFDIIKVDGQFVDNLESSHENQRFIKALVDLASLFDAKTVVEWVEDETTSQLLQDWGVDYLQGFKFGKPKRELPWPLAETSSTTPALAD
jgi:diguanylate cyclase (GGDEF)-like protein